MLGTEKSCVGTRSLFQTMKQDQEVEQASLFSHSIHKLRSLRLLGFMATRKKTGSGRRLMAAALIFTKNQGVPGPVITALCILYHLLFPRQLVNNPPAMWETWVRSLGWEDPLEKRTATHQQSGLENSMDSLQDRKESDMTERLSHTQDQGGVEHGGWCINSKVRLQVFESQPYHYVIT